MPASPFPDPENPEGEDDTPIIPDDGEELPVEYLPPAEDESEAPDEEIVLHKGGFIATDHDVLSTAPRHLDPRIFTEAGDPTARTVDAGMTPIRAALEPRVIPGTSTMTVGGLLIPPTNLLTGLLYGFSRHPSMRCREYYFWRVCDLLWNRPELPDPLMLRNPWAERMVWEALNNRYLAIGGAASSAKSHTMAAYGYVNWLARPADTLILMTSTTLTQARKRIWGALIRLATQVEGAPLKIRDSIGSAAYVTERRTLLVDRGLSLIAAERSRTREAVGNLIGMKAPYLFLIGDELSELSPAITNAAMSNLSKNRKFRYFGMANPNDPFDAFGDWATPEKGWESVDIQTADEWTTKYGGKYIRFDGERAPNVLARRSVYYFMPTLKQLEEDRTTLGEKSRAYSRMVRAVFFVSDGDDGIYSASELSAAGGMTKVDGWTGRPTVLAGIDPAFTNGGDRTIIYFAHVGYRKDGHFVCEFADAVSLNDDVTDKATPRTYQIAKQIKDHLVRRKVAFQNVAVDATGAGSPFCDVLAGELGNSFLRVSFGGKASARRVSANSRQTGDDMFVNRVSELWFVGKELLRTKQLYGITPELAKEMTGRNFDMRKGADGLRMLIEPKAEFRSRHGFSPDLADAAFLALDCARQRHGLVAMEPPQTGPDAALRSMRRGTTIRGLAHAQMGSPNLLPD